MADKELLQNILLSSQPCPICVDAAAQEPMTLTEWAASEWGLPGTSARYCDELCHCILVPVEVMAEFPALNERVSLRGEEGTEIRAVVELAPSEEGLKEIMDLWNATLGRLPQEIYRMPVLEIEAYLRKKYAAAMGGAR